MSAWGGGGSQITMPSYPSGAASLEFSLIHLAAAVTNPFTGQQQIQDWQTEYREMSFSLPAMVQSVAQPWVAFLESLNGIANVFQCGSALCAKYPESLMYGSPPATPRYWRLKTGQPVKWSIRKASIYGITFECREAI